MLKLRLDARTIATLEDHAATAFKYLKKAFADPNYMNANWARNQYAALSNSIEYATYNSAFMDWNRKVRESRLIERYILQYIVGSASSKVLTEAAKYQRLTGKKAPMTNTKEDMFKSGVKVFSPKTSYSQIAQMAETISGAERYDLILSLMSGIRKDCPKPKVR